jgi:hypothetical protein
MVKDPGDFTCANEADNFYDADNSTSMSLLLSARTETVRSGGAIPFCRSSSAGRLSSFVTPIGLCLALISN